MTESPAPITFTTTIFKDDTLNATGIGVPDDVVAALGGGKRPKVVVTIGGHSYRTTGAVMDGQVMLPLNQANRQAAGVEGGQTVDVTVQLDTAPRTVDVPEDLAAALAAKPGATAAFDALAPSTRKEHVRQVTSAKAQETRDRRIAKIVDGLP